MHTTLNTLKSITWEPVPTKQRTPNTRGSKDWLEYPIPVKPPKISVKIWCANLVSPSLHNRLRPLSPSNNNFWSRLCHHLLPQMSVPRTQGPGPGTQHQLSAGYRPTEPRAAKAPTKTTSYGAHGIFLSAVFSLGRGEPLYILVGAAGRGRLSGSKQRQWDGAQAPQGEG